MSLVEITNRPPYNGAIGRVMFVQHGLCWVEFDPPLIVPYHFEDKIYDATHKYAFILEKELVYLGKEPQC